MNRVLKWAFLYDQEPFEVFSICLKVLTTAMFLTATPGRLEQSRTLLAMNQQFPLWGWGLLTAAVAIFHIYAMTQKRWVIRKASLMTAIIYWLFLFFVYVLNGAAGVVILMLPLLAVFMTWAYLRLAFVERAETRVANRE